MQSIINGKWADASDKSTLDIVNPYTGKVLYTVPNCTEKDVNRAVEYAQKSQKKVGKCASVGKGGNFGAFFGAGERKSCGYCKNTVPRNGKTNHAGVC